MYVCNLYFVGGFTCGEMVYNDKLLRSASRQEQVLLLRLGAVLKSTFSFARSEFTARVCSRILGGREFSMAAGMNVALPVFLEWL